MSNAFQDDFTAQSGSLWLVCGDPFPAQVSELAFFLSRSLGAAASEAREKYVEKAVEKAEKAQEEDEEAIAKADEGGEDLENHKAKREVVKELVEEFERIGVPEGGERELESFVALLDNLLCLHFVASNQEFQNLVTKITDILAKPPSGVAPALLGNAFQARYNALTNLFNSVPSATPASSLSTLCIHIFLSLLRLAALASPSSSSQSSSSDIADLPTLIQPALEDFLPWLLERGFGLGGEREGEGVQTVESVVEILEASSSQSSSSSSSSTVITGTSDSDSLIFNFVNEYFSSISGVMKKEEDAKIQKLCGKVILIGLRDQNWMDFFSLNKGLPIPLQDLVSSNDTETAFSAKLLEIYLSDATESDAISTLKKFISDAGEEQLSKKGLDKGELERKWIRLALADLCAGRVGGSVKYEEVAKVLGLAGAGAEGTREEDRLMEVEMAVIDCIQHSLLTGRLNQPLRLLLVESAQPRSFPLSRWSDLQSRLAKWKRGLDRIIENTTPLGGTAAGISAGGSAAVRDGGIGGGGGRGQPITVA